MNKKLKTILSVMIVLIAIIFSAHRGYQFGQWLKVHDLF
jgi:hypothetical protein